MSFYELIKSRRSIRQFQPKPVPEDILKKCADAARLAPSAANLQPLEYILVNDPAQCERIFPLLRWAAYIQPKGNPKPGQHPTAYLIILINESLGNDWKFHDVGAAVENFILAAWSQGIGSCWLASVDRDKLRVLYKIPEDYKIDSVLALGYPAEEPVAEDRSETVRYWQDDTGRLHVPKRPLEKILHLNLFNTRKNNAS
ncbi:MAG: nitroreductase family protein [Candidatus Marinimicrobia bacterium]|nr:nitroreductase family protein [Candidatus Neomarinimicrobiota bacterium]